MKTPFEILGIAEESDDEMVKKGYLTMVKRFPPERFPKEFQRIRKAYDTVKTEKDRLRFSLFDTTLPDVGEMIQDIKADATGSRPNLQILRKALAEAVQHTEPIENRE